MSKKSPYDRDFFIGRVDRVKSSADVIVKLIHQLFRPTTLVDVGCGDGDCLAEWSKLAVESIRGIDGNWVDPSILKLPKDRLCSLDLNQAFDLDGRFDLCTCF